MLIFSALTVGMERSELFRKANIYMVVFQWRAPQVALAVKNLPPSAGDLRDAGPTPGQKDSLEEGTANYSSIFAWKIPWTEESMELPRVGHY